MDARGGRHPKNCDFLFPQFWLPTSEGSRCAEAGEDESGQPNLSPISWLYNGIKSTSHRAKRNFSALLFVIGSLHSSTPPGDVELMILRFNRLFFPEVKAF